MYNDPELFQLAEQTGEYLQAQQMMICTAESCTGGWLAEVITAVPGSSAWFDCGFVTYSNSAKQRLLSVPEVVINEAGAVSEPTAIAMAQGGLAASQADLCVSITGIAGPGGATVDKPLGTVWLAWQVREREAVTRCHQFDGDRHAVRRQAVKVALEMAQKLRID